MASEFASEPEQLRDHLAELLTGKSDLFGAKILSRKVANLQNQIEISLAKEGLLILVLIPSLKPKAHQSATLLCDPANITVRVVENVLLNKTGRSAFYIATRVAALLQLHTPPFTWCGEITVSELRELNIISAKPEEDEEDDYSAWDVLARTRLSIHPRSTTN
jgi:hypothetical protein